MAVKVTLSKELFSDTTNSPLRQLIVSKFQSGVGFSVCVLMSPFVLHNSSHPKKICWKANKKCADCPERGPTYVCHVLRAQKGICLKMVRWSSTFPEFPLAKLGKGLCCQGLDFQIFVCQSCAGIHREHGKPRSPVDTDRLIHGPSTSLRFGHKIKSISFSEWNVAEAWCDTWLGPTRCQVENHPQDR